MEQKQEKFSTIGYIAAALGMCIGTGNVWRFPRVCGERRRSIYHSMDDCNAGICCTASFYRDGIR